MVAASLVGTSAASAAFPNYSDCPRAGAIACIDIQSESGTQTIKGTDVPIGRSINIRGAIRDVGGEPVFVPPAGTNGLFTTPIQIPGGLLGIDFPIPGNSVAAIAQLAGPASSLRIYPGDFNVRMPLKLKLENPILGPFCQIGSNSSPINVNLIIGTTNPPAPNRPISGAVGTPSIGAEGVIIDNNVNVDNTFSVPSATNCGLGLGLINGVINLKMGLPSAAGNNALVVTNDVGLQLLG